LFPSHFSSLSSVLLLTSFFQRSSLAHSSELEQLVRDVASRLEDVGDSVQELVSSADAAPSERSEDGSFVVPDHESEVEADSDGEVSDDNSGCEGDGGPDGGAVGGAGADDLFE
jgi:hypothetical protein